MNLFSDTIKFNAAPFRYNLTLSLFRVICLVKRFTKAQDEYNKLLIEQVNRNRKSIKLQAFIDEIKDKDALIIKIDDRLFNLTILNLTVKKKNI